MCYKTASYLRKLLMGFLFSMNIWIQLLSFLFRKPPCSITWYSWHLQKSSNGLHPFLQSNLLASSVGHWVSVKNSTKPFWDINNLQKCQTHLHKSLNIRKLHNLSLEKQSGILHLLFKAKNIPVYHFTKSSKCTYTSYSSCHGSHTYTFTHPETVPIPEGDKPQVFLILLDIWSAVKPGRLCHGPCWPKSQKSVSVLVLLPFDKIVCFRHTNYWKWLVLWLLNRSFKINHNFKST